MRTEIEGKRCNLVFDSMADMVQAVESNFNAVDHLNGMMQRNPSFYGASSMDEVLYRAINGFPGKGVEAMEIANHKVSTLEREIDMPAFASFYDLSGADVDVARYLSGEPENMISYHMVDTPRAGRIICLVANVCTSCVTSAEAIKERGMQVVALALAIEKIGFQVELWADFLAEGGGFEARIRTRLKTPGEVMDPDHLVFAMADPSYLRGMCFAASHLLPVPWHGPLGIGDWYGYPKRGEDDQTEYPEGCVFIPSFEGKPGAVANLVTDKLRELGIVS